ncbi:MAG: hypothetical protein ACE5KX_05240, partial [Acidimicrobiia bacterium]
MRKPGRRAPAVLVVALALVAAACTQSGGEVTSDTRQAQAESVTPTQSFAGTDPAPEFPGRMDWLNTDRPLTLAELRGKVVLLDFWTYG